MEPTVITGRYAQAKVFATLLEEGARTQIQTLCDSPFVEGEKISIMPDVHSGKGCVIGYTQTVHNGKVCPSLVGVDISCGMLTIPLGKIELDLPHLDALVHKVIPTGMHTHRSIVQDLESIGELACLEDLVNVERLRRSIGTLGGGNHFIEVDVDEDGCVYLVIHSGSRNLGKQVCEIYQEIAHQRVNHHRAAYRQAREALMEAMKAEGRFSEIQTGIKELEKSYRDKAEPIIGKDLAWLEGQDLENYLKDMKICSDFAHLSRKTMAELIIRAYFGHGHSLDDYDHFETLHNYIDLDAMIIRKGAISAKRGEKVLIPISMRDGSLICTGRGNEEYNCSACHGAGRRLSRKKAFETLSMDEFVKEMDGIYSTSVVRETLDESPMAYKRLDDILPMLEGTCDVVKHIRPIYSFKATSPE